MVAIALIGGEALHVMHPGPACVSPRVCRPAHEGPGLHIEGEPSSSVNLPTLRQSPAGTAITVAENDAIMWSRT